LLVRQSGGAADFDDGDRRQCPSRFRDDIFDKVMITAERGRSVVVTPFDVDERDAAGDAGGPPA